jgi:hypothetical protein
MNHDINQIKSDIERKNKQSFEQDQYLEQFIQEILNNFAHRYFDQNQMSYMPDRQLFKLSAIEANMKQALKSENKAWRDKLVKNIQLIGLNNSPKAYYQVSIEILEQNANGKMKLKLTAQADCDETFNNSVKLSNTHQYQDFLDFRNNFARHLEEVFSLF